MYYTCTGQHSLDSNPETHAHGNRSSQILMRSALSSSPTLVSDGKPPSPSFTLCYYNSIYDSPTHTKNGNTVTLLRLWHSCWRQTVTDGCGDRWLLWLRHSPGLLGVILVIDVHTSYAYRHRRVDLFILSMLILIYISCKMVIKLIKISIFLSCFET